MSRFNLLFMFLFCAFQLSQSQLRYVTAANTSTITSYGYEYQMTIQNKSNVLIAFKRGTGATSADREIRVAYSADAGRSFTESNITIPTNTGTFSPVISSTTSSVVAIYQYDSSVTRNVCLARSTNGGSSFTLSSVANSNLSNAWLETFISDGVSKYYVGDNFYLFASTDDGVSFKQMKTPSDMSSGSVSYARWVATPNYLWVVYNKEAGDSIYVYRSSDNGNTYQFITQYFVDFPSNYLFSCYAVGDQLYISWVHEEVGTYSLRMRTITGTTVGPIRDVLVTTSSIDKPILKKTSGRVFIGVSDQIFQSTDSGNTWSRGSDVTTEIKNIKSSPNLNDFIPLDDTTIYLHLNSDLTGSLTQILFANWKWTDFPITDLTDDTLITLSSSVDIGWWNRYVETPIYRLQMSNSPSFSQVIFDTLGTYYSYIPMKKRFQANETRYYYRVRGEDNGYNTSWSPTKSFRYGSSITGSPSLTAPINGSTVTYPNIVNFQWGSVTNADNYVFHMSSTTTFTDTLNYFDWLSETKTSAFPWKGGLPILNGTFYWRVRGLEYETGSTGPWSVTWSFNYTGATGVSEEQVVIPKDYSLSQNFPNPFNPSTRITFTLPFRSRVTVYIYNILGQVVSRLLDTDLEKGFKSIDWEATVSSGTYILRLEAISLQNPNVHFESTRKMILMR